MTAGQKLAAAVPEVQIKATGLRVAFAFPNAPHPGVLILLQ